MSAVPGVRALRMRRACERWLEDSDTRGCPLEVLVEKAVESASNLARDLTPHEVNSICMAAVAAHVASEEQRLAGEAIAGAREEERLAYLRRKAEEYRLTADERITPARGRRT